MTVADLRSYLALGRTTAYALIASGDLPAIRIGRSLRVSRADVDVWLNNRSSASPLAGPK